MNGVEFLFLKEYSKAYHMSASASQENQFQEKNLFGLFVFDFFKILIIAVAVIIPIRWFLFQPFVVTGDSMEPTFLDGDYLIIDEISYRFGEPARGEVVVLRFPNDPSQFFIKRVIGLPGERVVLEGGRVAVIDPANGRRTNLEEEYLPPSAQTFGNVDQTLTANQYFVLGDNRLSSSDSRIWGPVERDLIVGRVLMRAFPIGEFQVFSAPEYN